MATSFYLNRGALAVAACIVATVITARTQRPLPGLTEVNFVDLRQRGHQT